MSANCEGKMRANHIKMKKKKKMCVARFKGIRKMREKERQRGEKTWLMT